MKKIWLSYLSAVVIGFVLNGYALLQHLAMAPRHDGFIAAVLIANMICVPIALWAAFVYGEVDEGAQAHKRRR